MYLEIIKLLKDRGIKLDAGLTQSELEKIYEIYKIKFPLSLKSFFTTALPVSDDFYDWRDFSSGNVTKIKNMMQHFYDFVKSASFEEYIPNSSYSPDQWCKISREQRVEVVAELYKNAPKIIPVYFHRFMPEMNDDNDPPVLSIYYGDIVYYGRNLQEYLLHEFCGVDIPKYISEYKNVPFWTDMMENL